MKALKKEGMFIGLLRRHAGSQALQLPLHGIEPLGGNGKICTAQPTSRRYAAASPRDELLF